MNVVLIRLERIDSDTLEPNKLTTDKSLNNNFKSKKKHETKKHKQQMCKTGFKKNSHNYKKNRVRSAFLVRYFKKRYL